MNMDLKSNFTERQLHDKIWFTCQLKLCHSIRLFRATAFQESCLVYFLRCNLNNSRSKTKVKVNETFFLVKKEQDNSEL